MYTILDDDDVILIKLKDLLSAQLLSIYSASSCHYRHISFDFLNDELNIVSFDGNQNPVPLILVTLSLLSSFEFSEFSV